jgi:hypothetical protein
LAFSRFDRPVAQSLADLLFGRIADALASHQPERHLQ